MKPIALACVLLMACGSALAQTGTQTQADRDRAQALKSERELDRIKHVVARDAKRMERAKKAGDAAGEAKWHAEMEKHHAQAKRQKRKVIADRKRADASEERERAARSK